MRLKTIFLLVLSLVSFAMWGQDKNKEACNYVIKGRVYDAETKAPLDFVNVQLEGTTQGTTSNEEGLFEFNNLCGKEYDLIFSYVGYKLVRHHHDFHHPFLEIFLAQEGYVMESVVVEATSLQSNLNSVATSKLSGEELEAVSSGSLGDVVNELAGVGTLKTGQNIVKPVIHGLHSNRILIINSGIRHEFQNWGAEHAPEIDPSLIEAVEVVKGAGTVRFGPDALGGVILVNPPKMELSTPLKAKLQLNGRSNGRAGEATAELRKGFKWLSLLAGGSLLEQGDLRAPDYMLTNTGKKESSYYGGFRVHPFSKLDIEGYYSRFDQNLGILSGSVFSNLEDLQRAIEVDTPLYTLPFSYDIGQPRQQVRHELYKASMRYVGDRQSFKIQYGYQTNDRQEFGVRRTEAPNIDLILKTESLDADWSHPAVGSLRGKLGVQWLKKANDNQPGTNTVPFIPNYDEQRWSAYLIESLPIGKGLFEAGVRFDFLESDITGREPNNTIYRNKILYRNFSGTLGLELPLNEHATFRSNIGTAWRAPDVAELYRFGQHTFFIEYGLWRYTFDDRFDVVSTSEGILDQNDRAVPAETGYKWINSYELVKEDVQLEFTAYVNFIENYIFSKPAGLTRTARGYFVYFIYDQADALLWGADLTSRWTHSRKLSSEVKGSFLWSRQLNPRDYFAGQPPPRLSYQLTYQPKLPYLSNSKLELDLDYSFRQFQHPRILSVEEFLYANQDGTQRFTEDASDFDLLAPPPAYLLTHLRFSTAWKQLRLRLEVQNLFDVSYRNYTDRLRYFADDLGRNFIIGIHWQI